MSRSTFLWKSASMSASRLSTRRNSASRCLSTRRESAACSSRTFLGLLYCPRCMAGDATATNIGSPAQRELDHPVVLRAIVTPAREDVHEGLDVDIARALDVVEDVGFLSLQRRVVLTGLPLSRDAHVAEDSPLSDNCASHSEWPPTVVCH